jgi:hypothetical protein
VAFGRGRSPYAAPVRKRFSGTNVAAGRLRWSTHNRGSVIRTGNFGARRRNRVLTGTPHSARICGRNQIRRDVRENGPRAGPLDGPMTICLKFHFFLEILLDIKDEMSLM